MVRTDGSTSAAVDSSGRGCSEVTTGEPLVERPTPDRGTRTIELDPGRVLRWTTISIAVLLLLSVLSQLAWYLLRDLPGLDFLGDVLWADSEQSLATLFSVLLLLSCAATLWTVSRAHSDDHRRWRVLSWIFVYLASDEFLSLHERLIDPVREGLGLSGVLYYAWVVPAMLAVVVVVGLLLPFVLRLPRDIRILLILSGAMYVGGAVGFEMLATAHVLGGADAPRADLIGNQGLGYLPYSTTEEGLEMGGAALLLYAVLRYLRDHLGGGGLTFVVPAVERV